MVAVLCINTVSNFTDLVGVQQIEPKPILKYTSLNTHKCGTLFSRDIFLTLVFCTKSGFLKTYYKHEVLPEYRWR